MAQYDRLPWFKFFVVDWLTDPLVCSLNLAQQGLFLRLLCLQWREGSLPEEEEMLRRICRVGPIQWTHGGGDTEIWMNYELSPKTQPPLYDFINDAFPAGKDGRRRNPKLERIRVELERVRTAQSKGGKGKSLRSDFEESKVDSDTDSDVDPPTGEKKGDSDAATAAIGSRYVRVEGDVVWFTPDGSLDWAKTATDEFKKHFPAMTRQLARRGGDWLSELRSLSSWHATAPKSKKKRVSAQRWLFGRLFRKLERGAVHAEQHQPKGNGRGHPNSTLDAFVAQDRAWGERELPPTDPEIVARHQKREEARLAKAKAWREEKPPPGLLERENRKWWEEHQRRKQ